MPWTLARSGLTDDLGPLYATGVSAPCEFEYCLCAHVTLRYTPVVRLGASDAQLCLLGIAQRSVARSRHPRSYVRHTLPGTADVVIESLARPVTPYLGLTPNTHFMISPSSLVGKLQFRNGTLEPSSRQTTLSERGSDENNHIRSLTQ